MRIAIALLIAVCTIIGVGVWFQSGEPDTQIASVSNYSATFGADTYEAANADIERTVADRRTRLEGAPGQWLHHEQLANALIERFSYSNDIADLEEAEQLLATAMDMAPDGSGPALTSAVLAMETHDLDTSEVMLDRNDARAVAGTRAARANALDMRGDIAFQRGDLTAAQTYYVRANDLSSGFGTTLRMANHALWSGEPQNARDMAERGFLTAQLDPSRFARMALIMANMSYAQGDIDRAGEWVAKAQSVISGDWLVQTYAAQQAFAEGNHDRAIADLKRIAVATGQPDVMDLLSGFLLHTGDEDEAAMWTARAGQRWEEKLAEAPAAYRLHAAEHYLDFGDPARALELARAEVEARPQGETIEVYASAAIANGNPQEALRWLDKAQEGGWTSVSLLLAKAEALEAIGNSAEADRVEQAAIALSPAAMDPMRKLIRFGHY